MTATTKTKLTVLEEISGLLSDMSPEDFIAPTRTRNHDNIVGFASDQMQRLYTLYHRLDNRVEALNQQITALCPEPNEDGSIPIIEAVEAAAWELHHEGVRLRNISWVAKQLFQLETLTQFEQLRRQDHPRMYNDWSVGWETPYVIQIFHMGGDPMGLKEFLRGTFGVRLEEIPEDSMI